MAILHNPAMHRRAVRKAERPDAVPLNLVSMIDVFTTLVFFLMLTSASVTTMRTPKSMALPPSSSDSPPADMAIVMVTQDQISFQGTPVMSMTEARKENGAILQKLKSRLVTVPQHDDPKMGAGHLTRGEINIMADKDLPFEILNKVMSTCGGDTGFSRISLSVSRNGGHVR